MVQLPKWYTFDIVNSCQSQLKIERLISLQETFSMKINKVI